MSALADWFKGRREAGRTIADISRATGYSTAFIARALGEREPNPEGKALGAPKKVEPTVQAWALANPGGTTADCARETGYSLTLVKAANERLELGMAHNYRTRGDEAKIAAAVANGRGRPAAEIAREIGEPVKRIETAMRTMWGNHDGYRERREYKQRRYG